MSTGPLTPIHRFSLCLLALLALPVAISGCGDDDDDDDDLDASVDAAVDAAASCEAPELPTGPGTLSIGFAGAPLELFAGEDDPDFATPFAAIAEDGANLFAPTFVTEDAANGRVLSGHVEHFLAPDCEGESNPYDAARDANVRVVFPGFALIEEAEWTAPLVQEGIAARLQTVVDTCMGGDDAVLGGVELFDKPAYTATSLFLDEDPSNDIVPQNIPVASAAFRSVTDARMFVIEGALQFYFDRYPDYADLTQEERQARQGLFNDNIDAMAGAMDVFGFETDPVDKPLGDPPTLALDIIGQYADQARSLEPESTVLAVLQGFGDDDLGARPGRRPTTEETRFMAVYALIHGARIIWWYGQSAIESTSPLWEDIRVTTRELRFLAPLLDLERRDLSPQISRVEARGFADGNTIYVLAANPASEEQRLTIPLFNPDHPKLSLRDVTTGEVLAAEGLEPYVEMIPGHAVRILSLTACD